MTVDPIESNPCFRNPQLMNAHDTALLIIDVQEKLMPMILDKDLIEWNIGRLIRGAQALGVATFVTEQYPQGLGGTIAPILNALSDIGPNEIPSKKMFSCRECAALIEHLHSQGIRKLLLTGIETHVCVAQSAFDLLANGFSVYFAVDAIGSRERLDHDTAIRRLEGAGATPTTTEAALFEWCERAGTDAFKVISALIREPKPSLAS